MHRTRTLRAGVRFPAAGRTPPWTALRTPGRKKYSPRRRARPRAPLRRMARYADLEFRAAGGAPPLRHRFHRQRNFSQVNSRRARGQRDVQPVVDQNASCRSLACPRPRARTNSARVARLKILFANLNPVHSGGCRVSDGFEQCVPGRVCSCMGQPNRNARPRARAGRSRSRGSVYVRVATESARPRNMLPASRISSAPRPVTAPRTEGCSRIGNQVQDTYREKNCDPSIPARGPESTALRAERHRGSATRAGKISSGVRLARLPEKGNPLGDIPVIDVHRVNLGKALETRLSVSPASSCATPRSYRNARMDS